ncbi:MAG: hypothetical protein ACLSU4_07900 [Streptococcus salivarius]
MASSSDAVEAITLTGKEVSASIDAYLFDALYSVDGIFTKGNQMEASIVSNNKIRIADGLLINQGHFLRIKPGMYCDVPIENGTQNMKRCDCIVAQFKIDESGESHDIVVIKFHLEARNSSVINKDDHLKRCLRQIRLFSSFEWINISRSSINLWDDQFI